MREERVGGRVVLFALKHCVGLSDEAIQTNEKVKEGETKGQWQKMW